MPARYDIPAAFAGHLRTGTCSRKYDSWKGLVYDPDKPYRPDDYLPDYARHFTTVEIDQWFWSLFPGGVRLPDPDTVKRYADSVPNGFRFTVKVPNAITLTHSYAKQPKGQERHAGEGGRFEATVVLPRARAKIRLHVAARRGEQGGVSRSRAVELQAIISLPFPPLARMAAILTSFYRTLGRVRGYGCVHRMN